MGFLNWSVTRHCPTVLAIFKGRCWASIPVFQLTSQVAQESGIHEMLTMSSSNLQLPPSPIPSISHSSRERSLPEHTTRSVARRPSSTFTMS